MPIVDATFYLKSYYHADAPIYRIHKPDGRGDSPANPAFVPKGTSYVGAQVTIRAVNEWFYNRNNIPIGGSHMYVDGIEIWVSSLETERVFGEDAGWPIYTYEGQHPDDYISVDTTDATGGQGPMSNDITGNGLIVSVWIRCWQVWPWGEWSWEWRRIYRSEPLYLETAPYIYAKSTPSDAAVTIDGNYVGQTPGIFVIQEKFENRDYPLVKVTLYKRKPYEKQVTLWWPGISEFDYGYAIVNGTLDYIGCTSPEGDHGDTACQGYNQIKCNAGVWEPLNVDSPACGYPKPKAKFSAKWTEGSPPLVVTFTDLSTDNPKAWTWDFGDGTGSSEQNPTHTYTTPGGHLVYFEVANQSGTDSAQATITVKSPCTAPGGNHGDLDCVDYDRARCNDGTWEVFEENSGTCGYPAPVADFSASTVAGYAPLTIQFEDMSTQFPATWAWDFGDGITSDEQHPEHTYETPGDYLVTLTTSNHIGSSHTELAISVQEPEPEPIPILTGQTAQIVGIATMAGVGLVAIIIASRRDNKKRS